MQKRIEKANLLIEALPYIREFQDKTVVIKYGGSAMVSTVLRQKVLEDIALMNFMGINVVIVHGGGKHITEISSRLGIKSEFVNGLRVTDSETMMVTQMVLAGLINKDIVADINLHGSKACGLSGKDGSLILAKKKSDDGVDYGFVGEVVSINSDLLNIMKDNGYISVVSPLGVDENGDSLNINADVVAARIAQELKANKVIYLTDVDGLFMDKDDDTTLISSLDVETCKELKEEGVIAGGMIPKIDACMKALESGVEKVHIINGTIEHAIILEMFTDSGIGTQISLTKI